MNNKVNDFKTANNDIFLKFGVENKYFLSVLDECNWEIINDTDISIVKYVLNGESKTNLIVKKDDKPFVISKDGYTMVVAIDCIKIAFLFKDDLKN